MDACALAYMQTKPLSKGTLEQLKAAKPVVFEQTETWQAHLQTLGVSQERHVRIATEGALLGGLRDGGCSEDLVIVSDEAGQFKLLTHGLCWVHAERLIHQLVPLNDQHREDQQAIRGRVWDLYADLKKYQAAPSGSQKTELDKRFDGIFTTKTRFETLNQLLKRLHQRKAELLLILERTEIPLHTNGSEGDIRDYVKKRKVSGGARSGLGRRCRHTFASLKKTCRKLAISFWSYLNDRLSGAQQSLPRPILIQQRATTPP